MATYDIPASCQGEFKDEEVKEFMRCFQAFDQDGNGSIDSHELSIVMKNVGESATPDQLQALIAEVDLDKSGTVEFGEFLEMLRKLRKGRGEGGFARVVKKQAQIMQIKGAVGTHSFSEEEKVAFVNHINATLQGDPHLAHVLPIDPDGMDLFKAVRDGVLLCKLINAAVTGTIDERAMNLGKTKNAFQVNENQNLCVNSAKAIGCVTTNVGANDIIEGKEHLVLGLVWQIIRIQLLSCITLTEHPELIRLLEPGEELQDLLKLPPDQILLRWFNYHLKNAGHPRRVTNFGSDIKDSECYTVLLNQLAPEKCDRTPLSESDLHKRADLLLQNADRIECRAFVTPNDIVKGNTRLNLAFTANIFNKLPGLDPPTEEEQYLAAGLLEDDVGDSREERAFRMWINSLGIDTYVNNLFEDVRDGIVILQVFDKVKPGIVDWRRVNLQPKNIYKKVENTNYAVVLGKQSHFSLVNIGGKDIVEGNKKLVLGLIWQLMRLHTLELLKQAGDGKDITEEDIIRWSNNRVQAAGKPHRMVNFKDPTLATGLFLFDLLATVEHRAINSELVTPGATPEEKEANAKYLISCARKIGCTVFCLWEDIVEVKPKMILTFVGSCMVAAKQMKK